ncbi:MAG: hypothetical protein M3R35_08770 [Candidatus Eremiobacteraeota bacterium]|nr:hypothetical protein [Candidatus Eremiobacteraeota bacterium]
MAKISIVVPDEALELIDSIAENRSAFMVAASVQAAEHERRLAIDAEIAQSCRENVKVATAIESTFASTLRDGLE